MCSNNQDSNLIFFSYLPQLAFNYFILFSQNKPLFSKFAKIYCQAQLNDFPVTHLTIFLHPSIPKQH